MSDELRQLHDRAVNKARDRAYRKGLVGRHNVDTTVSYAVTGRADFVYVTLDNKTVITAINQAGVPQTEDYPVLLRKNLLGQWVIVDRDVSSSLGAPTAIPPSGVVAHATSHRHGGSDEVATATPGANAIVKADADGKIGGGWIDAVEQSTLGNAVLQLSSTATNDDPTATVYQNRVATTDATVTTLHAFTIPASTTVALVVRVVARRTGGAAGTAEDGAFYDISCAVKNVAGTATLIGAVTVLAKEDQAGWDATVDVTGATARLRVTGAVDNDVTWHMHALVMGVGA